MGKPDTQDIGTVAELLDIIEGQVGQVGGILRHWDINKRNGSGDAPGGVMLPVAGYHVMGALDNLKVLRGALSGCHALDTPLNEIEGLFVRVEKKKVGNDFGDDRQTSIIEATPKAEADEEKEQADNSESETGDD